MPVGILLKSMSGQELTEWMAFYSIEPFGEERDDFRSGIIAATVANVNRDAKRNPKPYQPQDFMMSSRLEEKERTEKLKNDPNWLKAKFLEVFGDRIAKKDKNA